MRTREDDADSRGERRADDDDFSEQRGRHGPPWRRHEGRHGGRHGGRGARPFDYGELRLLVLAMIGEQPRHGYELMKAIEERMGGSYSPSPGVIYPTLAWLEDMGYAAVEAEGGRKSFRITPDGTAFIAENRAAIDAITARMGSGPRGRPDGVPAPIIRAMENLKLALRLKLRMGALEPAAVEKIAAALDAAAQTVERS